MTESRMRSNLWKLDLLGMSSGAVLYYTVAVVFMQSRGLSLTQIVIVHNCWAAGVLMLAVPSGARGDGGRARPGAAPCQERQALLSS